MRYKIIDIEGVGATYALKLEKIGIKSPCALLKACATPTGRKKVAAESGISGKLILKCANHADLFRVKGVGPQFAELLEAAGVDTVKELQHRVPDNLAEKMAAVNEKRNLVNRIPSAKQLAQWIEAAKKLESVMKY